jgi:hypothetical protein
MRASRAAACAAAAAALWMVAGATPAAAGGSFLAPVRDTYQPGEVATLVGYVGRGAYGWVDEGPFNAYLQAGEPVPMSEVRADQGIPLGPLTVGETGRSGWVDLRVTISFTLPDVLAPGAYQVLYCNAACVPGTGLGDLVGGHLWVGVDPPSGRPVVREWPLDEPEIANLAPEALVAGPGYRATAGDIRVGRITASLPETDSPTPPTPRSPAPPMTPAMTPPMAAPPPTAAAVAPPATVVPPSAPIGADPSEAWWTLAIAGLFVAAVVVATVFVMLRVGRLLRRWAGPSDGRGRPASSPREPAGTANR